MNFFERVRELQKKNQTLLCVGLDPDLEKFPAHFPRTPQAIFDFNRAVVDATADLVCCFKPNIAFYEQHGMEGFDALKKTIEHVHAKQVPVILDAKRADIGNTATAYARALFEYWGADATTVNPYFGQESLESFLNYTEKGIFILCLTSTLLEDEMATEKSGHSFFLQIATRAVEWNRHGNVGLVVAANQADRMEKVRQAAPGIPFLIPGVGAQGGEIENAVRLGTRGDATAIINSSRSILYASSGKDFADAARRESERVRAAIFSRIVPPFFGV